MAVALLLPLVSGCASMTGNSWKADKSIVIESITHISTQQNTQKMAVQEIDSRLLTLEKTIILQQTEIAALTATVKSLRKGSSRHSASRKASKAEKKLANKLNKIESSIKLAALNKNVKPAIDPNNEKNSYTAAYLSLKSGKYDEASMAFKSLLNKFPKGEYTDQALYWLGESYFTQRKLSQAIKAFKRLTKDFPNSAKHAAALLKLATAYQEQERFGDAKAVLQRLIKQHPDSNAAEQARRRLEQLKKGVKK